MWRNEVVVGDFSLNNPIILRAADILRYNPAYNPETYEQDIVTIAVFKESISPLTEGADAPSGTYEKPYDEVQFYKQSVEGKKRWFI